MLNLFFFFGGKCQRGEKLSSKFLAVAMENMIGDCFLVHGCPLPSEHCFLSLYVFKSMCFFLISHSKLGINALFFIAFPNFHNTKTMTWS